MKNENTACISDSLRREYDFIYCGEKLVLPYRVFLPEGGREGKYPLLLYMHGFGECGDDNEKQLGVLGGKNILLDRVAERNDCIILAPQCRGVPSEYAWVDIGNVWNTGSRNTPGEPTVSMRAVEMLLSRYLSSDKVNTDRVYIVGLSMGGYATWELITRRPDVFAAAVPVCGAGFPSLADRIKNVPIWAFHGTEDTTVPPSGTRDMEKALISVGGSIKATYLDGYSHSIWDPAFSTPGLLEWLFLQKKAKGY